MALANLSVFCRFCAEVDKFLSPILLIYILMYELMICVPLYQMLLVSKKPHNFHRNPKSSHNSVCPFSANCEQQAATAQPSFPDCQHFPSLLCHQKCHYDVHCGTVHLSPSPVTPVHSTPHSLPHIYLRSSTLPVFTVRGSNPGGVRFSAPVQTGPGAHPASYKTGTGSFPGLKQPRLRVDHPHPSGAEVKERVYTSTPLPPSFTAFSRVCFTFQLELVLI